MNINSVPDSALAQAAIALRVRHDIGGGQPESVPVWSNLSTIAPWLDAARIHCVEPPHHAAKASEWLLDNEFHIRRAIRQVGEDMPPAFYRRLPRLIAPEFRKMPRVIALAHGMLEAAHMQVNLAGAVEFVKAYQRDEPLTIAELWAFPVMLRLACLETLVHAFSELVPELEPPFEQTPGVKPRETLDPTESVSRAISALMAISNTSWKSFFEKVSRVEAIFQEDPADIYGAMDFETRDRYRAAVEKIAAGSKMSEWDIASTALKLARAHSGSMREGHVGCWLVAEGRPELEKAVAFQAPASSVFNRFLLKHAGLVYGGALVGFGLASLALPVFLLAAFGAGPLEWIAGFLLSLVPASIISVTLTHWLVTLLVSPRVLPKLDVERGLPKSCPSALVMPVIIHSADEVGPLMERLESHWLSNPDPMMGMALLSDLADAQAETDPGDEEIETALKDGIDNLNRRYPEHAPFALLHRSRRFNANEGCWMGWERKRGKLEEFTSFILGHAPDAFSIRQGNVEALCRARFVVTADADTTAPPGAVNRLLGALAHPLNRVEFTEGKAAPVRGYTFIQPRVEISPYAGDRSLFTRLYTGDTAIDIYSRAVSDVYQDLFGEGIFTGKGGFDVAAFHQCLKGRVPENSLVSHDLFEGLNGRAALASDIVFYEEFPDNYLSYARRSHRWIRGDWQLLPWLGRYVPMRDNTRQQNSLSLLDRWKIIDNLRRSLIPIALLALATVGWLALPGHAAIWTVLTIAAPGAYLFTDLVTSLARGRRRGVTQSIFRQLADHGGRWLLAITFMAYEAAVAADAIVRTLWRVFVSRQQMLQWVSAAHSAKQVSKQRSSIWYEMAAAPMIALVLTLLLAIIDPAHLSGALPLLLLWFVSPEIARFINRHRQAVSETIHEEDKNYLRLIARRTWLFFETFAGAGDNWLPPDNYQTRPYEEIAHRTSPTNVGMMFISALAAWDFGYCGLRDLAARMTNGLDTLDNLETYQGHTLNWIDTKSLKSLEPRYVSTVDSGNLAVCLVTLSEGCLEAGDGPAMATSLVDGLADNLTLLRQSAAVFAEEHRRAIDDRIDRIASRLPDMKAKPGNWHSELSQVIGGDWKDIQQLAAKGLEAAADLDPHEIHIWLERTDHHLVSMRRDIEVLMPWQVALAKMPANMDARDAVVSLLPLPVDSFHTIDTKLDTARQTLGGLQASDEDGKNWLAELGRALDLGQAACRELLESLVSISDRSTARAFGMDFRSLYDNETRTFYIGYNLGSDKLDQHHYDLLASEARLTSYFAIAKRDVPAEHWFHLGRPITKAGGALATLSWNGSMFEFLMPALLLPSDPGRLLGQSERAAVIAQRQYGEKLGLPWGVSESGFAARDASHRYQYQAFGVPGLGLKRGLAEDYVVAPYASALALMVFPNSATDNLKHLQRLGMTGHYGFFEAADFTPDRRSAENDFTPIKEFMAHHQGMIVAAIGNVLNNNIMIRRFGREAHMRSAELLLQERVPWEFPPEQATESLSKLPDLSRSATPHLHGWTASDKLAPQLQVIGNGSLSSWITGNNGGALWWRGQSLTRWTGDAVCRTGDYRLYISEPERDHVWTLGADATDAPTEVTFHAHKVEFHERFDNLSTTQEVYIAPGDDVEIRRVTLFNDSNETRKLDLTSYAEIVLGPASGHERHPAFSKLFVHSERLAEKNALLFTRRPRRPADRPPVLVHRLLSDDASVKPAGYETDRRAFLGRHGNSERPTGSTDPLSGSDGWTLDPVMALRARVELEPGERAQFAFVTVAAGSCETALDVLDRYNSAPALDWAMEDALRSAALEARRLELDSAALSEAQALCNDIVFLRRPGGQPPLGAEAELTAQPKLWSMGLSGDLPILLVKVIDVARAPLLAPAIRAHQWWTRRGLKVDLVIMREGASGYQEPIRELLFSILRDAGVGDNVGGPGGVHLLSSDMAGSTERKVLENVARFVMDGTKMSLGEAVPPLPEGRKAHPRFQPVGGSPVDDGASQEAQEAASITLGNGYGGFATDNGDYVIGLNSDRKTPAPWSNVLANDAFGTIVTEAGLGFTWSMNSGEHRLTPWSNDPLLDPQAEALYLRDEENTRIWSPTPLPAGADVPHSVRHMAGATVWTSTSGEIEQTLTAFVPPDAPVKLVILQLTNSSTRDRRFTATYYAEWLLGAMASVARPHIVCGYHAESRALMARNGWNPEFGNRAAFLASSRRPHSLTNDRASFLGKNGDITKPAGLMAWSLDGALDNIADPCAAFQVHIDLAAGATEEVAFVLGEGESIEDAAGLALHWANLETVKFALADNDAVWKQRLAAVSVKTPDPAFDILVNRWLVYQTFASRIFARAGFHQAGGAFGFRDQLQDMMALLFIDPQRVRAHILECASRQFEQGDVLHWWHPPLGRGIKTRCSDDLLWLVYATWRYVEATGDTSILLEEVAFLSAPPLSKDEEDRYHLFEHGGDTDTLFEHCRRAMDHGVTSGAHGLPLIGTGDWNDGMDRVGNEMRGESVWLAWFAAACADAFAYLADATDRSELGAFWRNRGDDLRRAVDTNAWDGQWYKRAFDDDGLAWGSSESDECRIDSISQSWAALAGGLNRKRITQALDSANSSLVDPDARLVKLLTPPFDQTPRDPGYIRAYPPGVRENGGQYTHAAAWLGLAHARAGNGDRAYQIFDFINPIGRTSNSEDADKYRGEPYALPGDVRGAEPAVGQSGWTWYTGAAGWTWQLAVDGILGISQRSGAIRIAPNLPSHWGGAEITLQGSRGSLHIVIEDPDNIGTGAIELSVNGKAVKGDQVQFPDNGEQHKVIARLGTSEKARSTQV